MKKSFFADAHRQTLFEFCRVVLEEIEIHRIGDFQNQVAVERRFVENLVDMVAAAWNLSRQPTYAAVILAQLLLDEVSNVKAVF